MDLGLAKLADADSKRNAQGSSFGPGLNILSFTVIFILKKSRDPTGLHRSRDSNPVPLASRETTELFSHMVELKHPSPPSSPAQICPRKSTRLPHVK